MGRYIDWTDVSNRYPNMGSRADANEGNNFYIVGAEAEVDAAASQKYAVPFIVNNTYAAPALIKDVTIDLAYWKAIGWQNEKLSKVQRDDIDRRLEGIKDGTLLLIDNSGSLLTTGPSFAYSTQQELGNPRSSFGHDAPENWSVSQDLKDTEADQRTGDNGNSSASFGIDV